MSPTVWSENLFMACVSLAFVCFVFLWPLTFLGVFSCDVTNFSRHLLLVCHVFWRVRDRLHCMRTVLYVVLVSCMAMHILHSMLVLLCCVNQVKRRSASDGWFYKAATFTQCQSVLASLFVRPLQNHSLKPLSQTHIMWHETLNVNANMIRDNGDVGQLV